jgi:two-component system nitrate/nitrite response regulator NarL
LSTLSPDTAEPQLTCVVADDHPGLVEGLSLLLEACGVAVVGSAHDGAEALALVKAQRPAVAILDAMMGEPGGIEVARCVARSTPETSAIIYTGFATPELLVEALDAGARGFVSKAAPVEELVRAVTAVARGETYVDPRLGSALVARAGLALSQREREILRLLADGRSNHEIAKALFIAPDTVRTYIRRAMEKLGATTRTEAVAAALRRELIA